MQISITLDIATLNPSQFKAFVELAQSFRETYYIPESDVTPATLEQPIAQESVKRRRKSKVDAPAEAYVDLVHDITTAITAGKIDTPRLLEALAVYGVANLPELAQKLHLVGNVRMHLGNCL